MAQRRSNQPKVAVHEGEPASDPVLLPAIARLGVPVGIFGATFLVIAIVLTLLFSPDRFPVRVGDKTVKLHNLEAEQKSLLLQRATLTEERQTILREADAPTLHQVVRLRGGIINIGAAMIAIEGVRRSFQSVNADPISIPGVTFDAEARSMVIAGDVRDTGERSMQILASFVDELRAIPMLSSVSEPEYASQPIQNGGTISHFTMTLRFPHE